MRRYFVLGIVGLGVSLVVGSSSAQAQNYKVVAAGQRVKMDTLASLDPTCRSLGRTEVNLLTAPQGGQVETLLGRDYPAYVAANVRSVCDKQRVPVTMIFYRASPGFSGSDSFDAEIVFPQGNARRVRYKVEVR